jgi:type IV pilus assembly protein PilM
MALPFLETGTKKSDQIVAVDLGSRTTKAVHVQTRGNSFALCGFVVMDAPIFDKTLSVEALADHLKAVTQILNNKTKQVALTLSVNDALVKHVDMPPIPVEEMRAALKLNSRAYLQQDLRNYVFDCEGPASNGAAKTAAGAQKQKVLVAGAKEQLIDTLVAGAKAAGLKADHIVPAAVSPLNAFERALPDVFRTEAVALVDVGFKSSSICISRAGELLLNRVVSIGGDRLTAGLSELMNITYAEAEGIKVGMAHEVESHLESLLIPLGRELRASIDFFEHQNDCPISRVYLSGGSARSEYVVLTLQRELAVECKLWNPTANLELSLPSQQSSEIEQIASQLAVALGAAITAL